MKITYRWFRKERFLAEKQNKTNDKIKDKEQ